MLRTSVSDWSCAYLPVSIVPLVSMSTNLRSNSIFMPERLSIVRDQSFRGSRWPNEASKHPDRAQVSQKKNGKTFKLYYSGMAQLLSEMLLTSMSNGVCALFITIEPSSWARF